MTEILERNRNAVEGSAPIAGRDFLFGFLRRGARDLVVTVM